ncbi:hypothetical protein ACFL2A_05950 [Thermodesulfobacteriota bacterium]
MIIDTISGSVNHAAGQLIIDGINLFANNFPTAAAGYKNSVPWVFMFADGTPAKQDFQSAIAVPKGLATNMASSVGFLGSAFSTAFANGLTGQLMTLATTTGLASANALAGIGSTFEKAKNFSSAFCMHIGTIILDPLSSPDKPAPQPPPGKNDKLGASISHPASTSLKAFMLNENGKSYSIFNLKASLAFNEESKKFDSLEFNVTGTNGEPYTKLVKSDFKFKESDDGSFLYSLEDINIEVPYSMPSSWENLKVTTAFEAQLDAVSNTPNGDSAEFIKSKFIRLIE